MIEALVKILATVLPWARRWLDDRRAGEHHALIEANADLQHELRRIRIATGSCRALVLKATNGGGIPDIGSVAWVEVIHESLGDGQVSSVLDFRRRSDHFYGELLRRLLHESVIEIDPAELPESQLKTKYLSDDIVRSFVFPVAIEPGAATYYGSLNIQAEGLDSVADIDRRAAIDDGAQRIRDIFEKRSYRLL